MLVYCIALFLQFIVFIMKPVYTLRPTFTPMTVSLAGTHHFYNCERAKKDMGYKPPVSLDEGIKITIESFSELRNQT